MNKTEENSFSRLRQRVFRMVSVGVVDDPINGSYDIISTLALIINLVAAFASTFDNVRAAMGPTLDRIEAVTVAFFALDYVLRLWTAKYLYPDLPEGKALLKYIFSFSGIVDLLSFLPYYLPVFFPSGAVVFRLFRIARIFRLFRINAYYDSLNVITEVIVGKKQQLLSSLFILGVLMLASSLCMYSLEHDAQPTVFKNAFSGIWWSVSTLLTVGYGDIYPITPLGKLMSIIITFLGVLMAAIPTGIISAGFVERFTRDANATKEFTDIGHIGEIFVDDNNELVGKTIDEIQKEYGMMIYLVMRDELSVLAERSLKVQKGDILITRSDKIVKPVD